MSNTQNNDAANTVAAQHAVQAPQPPIPPQPPVVVPLPLPPHPKRAPSSDNPVLAATPGWRFQPGNPGTMADVGKVVNSRVIDASKIYKGGKSLEFLAFESKSSNNGGAKSFASNLVQGPASIVELARALRNDPQLIFEFVYNNIDWQPGWGAMKGGLGSLLDGSGNSFDQSMLLVALLREAGFTANYVMGQIELPVLDYDAWFNTDSSSNSYCCYWYAQYANIPGNAPTWNGTEWTMVMSHVWVNVVISGTTYVLDPSRKSYNVKAPVANLATILGYNQSTFLTNAQSGATIDGSGNFVQNMNSTNVNADLTTMTSNLVDYIQNNAIGSAPAGTATVDDVLGGLEIVPITLPFAWNTSLSYQAPGDVPTIWTGDVPLTHKTTLQVQYPELWPGTGWVIDETFTSDQLAGTRLTLTFDATLHPVLSLNGTVIATGSEAQGVGSWNSILLTVNHNAYANPVYPQQWWQSFIYADQYYLIGNAWGSVGGGQADFHQTQLAAATANSSSTDEALNGESMSTIWWNWAAQSSRMADLAGRLNSTYMNTFHQVGMVSLYFNGTIPTPSTDIGGVSGFSSTLNYDFTQLSRTNTVAAMHGVALEAAILAQFNGTKPGVSTSTVIDKANRTAVVTLGGTVTVGNTLTITVNDTALSGGTKSKVYTVVGGDTLTTIAAGLTALINADTDLAAIKVTATSNGALILVSSDSVNQTSYTSSTSGGATETISIAWSKIFLANSSNWTSGINISATLTANGVAAGTVSSIGNYITGSGFPVIVPDQPAYALGVWSGDGYWALPPYSSNGGAFGLINNVSKGGAGQPGKGKPETESDPGVNYVGQGKSNDPIGLYSGDFFYNRTDMSIGSQSFPYGLSFERSYSSRNQYSNGPLGWGWTHNQATTASIGSDGRLAMGNEFAAQGAATLTELYVSMDLASDSTQPIVKVITMNLADKWWIDQIANNTVVIALSGGNMVFVRQPDGSYTAPSSFPSTLTLTGGLYSLTTPQGFELNFNSSGQISSWVSPAGVTVSYTYSSGLLATVSNGLGRTLTLTYTSGKLTSVTDGTGRSIQYAFDANGDLTEFTDATSNVSTYQYDQPGRMTQAFMPLNPATAMVTNVYDSLSRVKTQANARNQQWTYYFANSRTQEVDAVGNSNIYYFNRLGKATRAINALGFEVDSQYDGLNRLTQLTQPEGNSVQLTYDNNNNILTKTFVPKSGSGLANVQLVYTYDPTWAKLTTVVDGNGHTTAYGYDSSTGNLLTITQPIVGGLTPQQVMTYNSRGQLVTITDQTGVVTQMNYDSSTEKLTSSVVDYSISMGHLNLTTLFGYDAVGNCNSFTDANSNQWTSVFDNERRLTQLTSPSPFSSVVNFGYNANGKLTSSQQQVTSAPTWQTTSTTYTVTNKVETVTDPAGHLTTCSYDGADRLQTVTDAQGRVYQYAYDGLNRISTVTDPSNTVSATETYSNNGLRKSIKDAANNITQYSYDGFDRLSLTTFPDSTTVQFSSYDGNSNLETIVTRSGSSISMTYDTLNRLSTKSPAGQATVTYGYDLANRPVSISKPTVLGDPSTGTFQKSYDTAGRFYMEQYPDGKTVTHILDNNGNRTKSTWPDGYYVTRSFDQYNRLTNIYLNGSGAPSLTYGYDQLSRRSSVGMGNGTSVGYSMSITDDLSALTNNFVGASNNYSLLRNNAHELIGAGVSDSSFVWHPTGAGTVSYGTADNVNKYPSVGGVGFTYDGNKNLTYDGSFTYSFDTENHLLSATSGSVSASYVYDPSGRQAQKTVNGTATRFIYDGLNLIATYDGSGNLLNRYVFGPGIDEAAIQVSGAGVLSFFHRDFMGSVVATTNSSGAVTNKYSYGPFGESAVLSGTIFGFTGQRYDAETGLCYYKARYYSPNLGRFLQTDPIGYGSGDLNLYGYVDNSPLNAIDPSGQSIATLLGGLALFIIVGLVYVFIDQNKKTYHDVNGNKVEIKNGVPTLAGNKPLTGLDPILISEDGKNILYRTTPDGRAVLDADGKNVTIPVLTDGNGQRFYLDEHGNRVDVPKERVRYPSLGPTTSVDSSTQYVNKWTGSVMNTAWGTNGNSPETYVNPWTGTVMNTAYGTNGDSPSTYYNQWTGTTMNTGWGTNGDSPSTYYNQWTGTQMNSEWGTNGGKLA